MRKQHVEVRMHHPIDLPARQTLVASLIAPSLAEERLGKFDRDRPLPYAVRSVEEIGMRDPVAGNVAAK
jgi:hypothetical protein